MLKTLIRWNLLEKHEPYRYAFSHQKALKTDIYAVRFALRWSYLAARIRALYKNAQIITPVRFALTLFLK
jgi:hypothetical protein